MRSLFATFKASNWRSFCHQLNESEILHYLCSILECVSMIRVLERAVHSEGAKECKTLNNSLQKMAICLLDKRRNLFSLQAASRRKSKNGSSLFKMNSKPSVAIYHLNSSEREEKTKFWLVNICCENVCNLSNRVFSFCVFDPKNCSTRPVFWRSKQSSKDLTALKSIAYYGSKESPRRIFSHKLYNQKPNSRSWTENLISCQKLTSKPK